MVDSISVVDGLNVIETTTTIVEIITAGMQGPTGPRGAPGVPDYEAIESLQGQIDQLSLHKLDSVDYVERHLGMFTSKAELDAAHPTARPGDSADIDSGAGFDVMRAIWDESDQKWVVREVNNAQNTDQVPEGNNNLYFTGARVRSTPLTSLAAGVNTPILATDSVVVALAKLQAQIASVPGAVEWVDVLQPFVAIPPFTFTDQDGGNPLQVAKINGMIWIRGALWATGFSNTYTLDVCFLPNSHKVKILGNAARGPATFCSTGEGSFGAIKDWGVQSSYGIFDPTNQKITILQNAGQIFQVANNVCTFIGVLGVALDP